MKSLSFARSHTHAHWGLLSAYRTELMGFACLWVMMHHNFLRWPSWASPLRIFMRYGNCGVDIFLLLSGISLFHSLRKKPGLKQFYLRRFLRLALPYVTICLPFWLWVDMILKKGKFWLDFTFITFPLSHVITFWYIPAIACFYFIAPFLFSLFTKTSKSPPVIGSFLAALVFISGYLLQKHTPTLYHNIEIAWLRAGIFIIGLSLGKWVYLKKKMSSSVALYSLLTVCAAFALTKHSSTNYWWRFSFMFIASGTAILLSLMLNRFSPPPGNGLRRFLRFFGSHSLELYLLHISFWKVWEMTPSLRLSHDTYNIIQNLCVILLSCFFAVPLNSLFNRILNNSVPQTSMKEEQHLP